MSQQNRFYAAHSILFAIFAHLINAKALFLCAFRPYCDRVRIIFTYARNKSNAQDRLGVWEPRTYTTEDSCAL